MTNNVTINDISFESQGVRCRGWWYRLLRPGRALRPCIIMAHGLGGTRNAGLQPYARRFAEAGFDVLLFDYRHFGDSDGQPRQLISIHRQLQDWAAAIEFCRQQPEVDPDRIGLWGTSFSGGHVLVAAARDGRVAAVSAQGPMMDGLAAVLNVARYAGWGHLLHMAALGIADQIRALVGLSPVYIPLVAPPGQMAAMATEDAEPGYRAIAPENWRNEATARLALTVGTYRPIRYARKLSCPILIQVCMADTVAPVQASIETARQAGEKAELIRYEEMGHFDIYVGEGFEHSSSDQVEFFQRVLGADDS